MLELDPGNPAERRIQFIAANIGEVTIEARSPDSRRSIQLRVYTRPLVLHTVAFYFVRDSATPQPHATQRAPAEAATILERLNAIYFPQANIIFSQVDRQEVVVPGDLGPAIDLPREGSGPEFAAIERATQASRVMGLRALAQSNHARVRVHFVNAVRRRGRRGDLEGVGQLGGDTLLVEDSLSRDVGIIVAHEVGHCLGLDHQPGTTRPGWMMYPTAQRLGTRIPKVHVDILNPAVT